MEEGHSSLVVATLRPTEHHVDFEARKRWQCLKLPASLSEAIDITRDPVQIWGTVVRLCLKGERVG